MEPRPRPSASPPCSDICSLPTRAPCCSSCCSARACGVRALEPLDLKKRHACVGGDGEGVGARLLLVLVHLTREEPVAPKHLDMLLHLADRRCGAVELHRHDCKGRGLVPLKRDGRSPRPQSQLAPGTSGFHDALLAAHVDQPVRLGGGPRREDLLVRSVFMVATVAVTVTNAGHPLRCDGSSKCHRDSELMTDSAFLPRSLFFSRGLQTRPYTKESKIKKKPL